MSDLMLLGILRMPLDDTPEGLGVIAWTQIKSVMREAANRIEADAARIAELEAAQLAQDKLILDYCSRITELEAALKPFADCVDLLGDQIDEECIRCMPTAGQVRAARVALEKKE